MPLSPEQERRRQELLAKKQQASSAIEQGITNPGSYGLPSMMSAVGEAIDPYTGAPVRAAVGEAMSGGKGKDIAKAFTKQIKAGEVLPSTLSGEDIVYKGMVKGGIAPYYAEPTSEVVGPLVGAGLDLTNVTIPGTPLVRGARMLSKVPGKALSGAVKAGKALEPLGMKAAEKVLNFGNVMTQGTLDVPKSLKATKNLTAMEQLIPGNKYFGPGKKAYEELKQLREIVAENPEIVEGSGKSLQQLRKYLIKNKDVALTAPNVSAMAKKLQKLTRGDKLLISEAVPAGGVAGDKPVLNLVDEAIPAKYKRGPAKDVTLGKLDELLHNVDSLSHTPLGNQRQVDAMLKPVMAESRGTITDMMAQSELGKNVLEGRSRASDLMTAAKGRGKLFEGLATAGALPTLGTSLLIKPTTYHRMIGAARLPKQTIEALDVAYNSGNIAAFKSAIDNAAKSHPKIAESLMRTMLLAPGRTDQGPSNIPSIDMTKKKKIIDIPTKYEGKR